MKIRPFVINDLPDIVQLSLLAWEPVFTAWQKILGPSLYPLAVYPDWRKSQAEVVEKMKKLDIPACQRCNIIRNCKET